MKPSGSYDYIIAGAGCAGLSLAMHLIEAGSFSDKKILVIDQHPKKSNDRTWCFWETTPGIFEPIVYHQWQKLWFYSDPFSRELEIAPYRYKMIRGIDFYNYCLQHIRQQANFDLCFEKVDHIFSSDLSTGILVNGVPIHCEYLFNSILFEKPELSEKEYWLLQHFKGWIIETEEKSFDPERATLMDFRMDQQGGTAFCYVLPFTETRALVEYTLFSPERLTEEKYREGLSSYIHQHLGISNFAIIDEEFGTIPMTNFRFSPRQNHIIHIGTAGGQTKPSSGYTFHFIQQHSARLVSQLVKNQKPFLSGDPWRFAFYDSILLHILHHGILPGRDIFARLFQRNPPRQVLKFLDNETSFPEDLRIIATLPTWPFLKAAVNQIF